MMKKCEICGCMSPEDAGKCVICGVAFAPVPAPHLPDPVPAPVPRPPVTAPVLAGVTASAAPVAPRRSPDTRKDRYAISGFVLSLIGALTCLSTPLQAVALILSCVGKSKRYRGLRVAGILLSAVSVFVSVLLWILVAVFFPQISGWFSGLNIN